MLREIHLFVIILAAVVLFGCGEEETPTTIEGGQETASLQAGQPDEVQEDIVVDLEDEDEILSATMAAQEETPEEQVQEKPVPKEAKAPEDMNLFESIRAGEIETAVEIIEEGAEVNIRTDDEHEFTPMMFAAGMGNLELVKALVENGADLDAKSASGQTALIWAARGGSLEVADYLLEQGADPDIKDSGGETALDWSKRNDNEQLQTLLKEHTDANETAEQPDEVNSDD